MILYCTVLDNGELCEDRNIDIKVYSTLEKAEENYNKERYLNPFAYGNGTIGLYSFDEDSEFQEKRKIKEKIVTQSAVKVIITFCDTFFCTFPCLFIRTIIITCICLIFSTITFSCFTTSIWTLYLKNL